MEEDIKILEKIRENIKGACECGLTSGSERLAWQQEAQAIENVLNRLKEDEEVIKEIVKFIDFIDKDDKICLVISDETCKETPVGQCENCIEKYFRKKVKDEKNTV